MINKNREPKYAHDYQQVLKAFNLCFQVSIFYFNFIKELK